MHPHRAKEPFCRTAWLVKLLVRQFPISAWPFGRVTIGSMVLLATPCVQAGVQTAQTLMSHSGMLVLGGNRQNAVCSQVTPQYPLVCAIKIKLYRLFEQGQAQILLLGGCQLSQ